MSDKGQTNSKVKTDNSKLEKNSNSKTNSQLSSSSQSNVSSVGISSKKLTIAQYLQSKKAQYSLMSVLVLGVLLISGLFTYNLLKQNADTAKASSTTSAGGSVTIDKTILLCSGSSG